ncbi:MAG: hypothetical protein VB048_07585 [Bacteroidaceae bacterium]|nr:hypothetical protein [Candidatus Elulimicrobiales bacterium]MEA4967958.1 hypothetical protein [Bacteroidaceae bacterium]
MNVGSIPALAASLSLVYMISYIIFIVAYIILYVMLNYAFQFIFKGKINKKTLKKKSFLIILFSGIFIFSIVFFIKDPEFANRVQHAIAGGFLTMLISYLSFKDSEVKLNKLQILILTALIVTFLGVLNEIFEFFVQMNTSLVFALSVNDTWLDLTANSFGIILGSVFILFDKNIKNK